MTLVKSETKYKWNRQKWINKHRNAIESNIYNNFYINGSDQIWPWLKVRQIINVIDKNEPISIEMLVKCKIGKKFNMNIKNIKFKKEI